MKFIALIFFSGISLASLSQAPGQKLSRDSVKYYQQELNKFLHSAYDSLRNSDRYKEIMSKLNPQPRPRDSGKVITVELLANAGLYFTNFQNLNTRLQSIGQEKIRAMVPSAGISIAVGKPVMTYGFELSTYAFDNKSASFKGIHTRLYTATNLFKKGPLVLHPQIGIAASTLNMFIYRSQEGANFNDLFLANSNSVELTHSQTYLDFALGLKLKSPKVENMYWQILRAGYRYGLKEEVWKARNNTITDAPADRNNQFYIQFCLGFDRE